MMKVIVTLPKPRNPFHKDLRTLGKRIVLARKGKGSYNRKRMRENSDA